MNLVRTWQKCGRGRVTAYDILCFFEHWQPPGGRVRRPEDKQNAESPYGETTTTVTVLLMVFDRFRDHGLPALFQVPPDVVGDLVDFPCNPHLQSEFLLQRRRERKQQA